MDEKQLEHLLKALWDIKAEIRDLRNDLRRSNSQSPERVGHRLCDPRIDR